MVGVESVADSSCSSPMASMAVVGVESSKDSPRSSLVASDSAAGVYQHQTEVHRLSDELYQLGCKYKDVFNENTGLKNENLALRNEIRTLKIQLKLKNIPGYRDILRP